MPILGNFSLLVRSFVRRDFWSARKFLDGPKIFQKLDRLDAVDFVKKSSKSEASSRFLSRSKFENFACHFLANLADRPRIRADSLKSRDDRLNSSKSGRWIFEGTLVADMVHVVV